MKPLPALVVVLSALAGGVALAGIGVAASVNEETPAREQEDRPFSIAVLRRDGLVVPFAVFDGRWKTPWPEGLPPEMPISLTDVPHRWWGVDEPFERMDLWRDGQRVGDVTINGITVSRAMCQPRVVLRSTYKPTAEVPPEFERPHPKDGLLVGGGARVQRIESVGRGDPDWNRAMVAITPEFNSTETRAAGGFSAWRHPVRADDRRLVPIRIESLYRGQSETPEWTSYFVEAVRQYPATRQDKDNCGPLTYVFGWVMLGPNDRSWVLLNVQITYCDRFGVRYMLPFGTIKARNRIYWVFQFAGAESEWYEITRPLPGRVESVASVHAGTCRY